MIDDRGHLIIGTDLEKLGLELIPCAYIYRNDSVLKPGLFEKHRDLVTVRSGPIIKVDHCSSFFIPGWENRGHDVRYRCVNIACVRARGRPDQPARANGLATLPASRWAKSICVLKVSLRKMKFSEPPYNVKIQGHVTVSYTHLTLPTILRV